MAFGGDFNPTENARRVAGSLTGNSFENIADNLNVNFATTTTPAGSIALQVAKINGRLLDLELSALERENNVEIIASPRLLTTNKKSASIKQGTEIPYIVSNTRNDTQSVEFREAVLGLEVMPHISKDNNILLDLLVSQNSLVLVSLMDKMRWFLLISKKLILRFCQRWGNHCAWRRISRHNHEKRR